MRASANILPLATFCSSSFPYTAFPHNLLPPVRVSFPRQEDNEIDGSMLQMMFEDKLKEEEEERANGGKQSSTADDRRRAGEEKKEDGDDILSASLKVEK
jgi:hypothetical protein